MQTITTYAQALDTDREYVSNFGAEGGMPELARALDATIDRLLPDVPGTEDDAVRDLLKKRLTTDVLNPQWTEPQVGPELHWTVAVRGTKAAASKATIELVRQHAVGICECGFALEDVPVVESVAATVTVEATCTALGYGTAAAPTKGRAGAKGAANRSRGLNVRWSAAVRVAIGPFTVTTRVLLRDLLYTVRVG
jgi:hypothetical protein